MPKVKKIVITVVDEKNRNHRAEFNAEGKCVKGNEEDIKALMNAVFDGDDEEGDPKDETGKPASVPLAQDDRTHSPGAPASSSSDSSSDNA